MTENPTGNPKISEPTMRVMREFFNAMCALEDAIEKGEPFSSVRLEKLMLDLPKHKDLPAGFLKMATEASKMVQQVKNLFASGLDTDRMVILRQIFHPFFQMIRSSMERVEQLARS